MMGLVGLISSVFLLLMYMAMEESRRACRPGGVCGCVCVCVCVC